MNEEHKTEVTESSFFLSKCVGGKVGNLYTSNVTWREINTNIF